jgi:hypothetical protein
MLTFRVIHGGEVVEIQCDARGVAVLLGALAAVMAERASHRHLRGPGAGGHDLDKEDSVGRKAVSEVIVTYVEAGDC